MTTLVTGAAGFIGFHVAKKLLARGERVIGFDNLSDYYDVTLKQDRLAQLNGMSEGEFVFELGDLESPGVLSKLCLDHQVTHIVHLAAQAGIRYSVENPQAYLVSNVVGFQEVLEATRACECEHLVYASSSSVYGNEQTVPFSTGTRVDQPVSVYAATKISNELQAHVYEHQYGIQATGLRFFTVYGPWGRPDMSPFLFVDAILRGEPIKVFNHGRHERDFTYVDDIAEGVIRVHDADHRPKQRIYNLGRGQPVNLLTYIETIEEITGKRANKQLVDAQPGDVEVTYADTKPLQQDFGYQPATNLETGLKKFIDWYRSYYKQ